jgi:EmrB/QacA subfamily drug resistance transporter
MSQETLDPKLAAAAGQPVSRRSGSLVPLIVGSALMLQQMEAFIIANALPTMAKALGEDPLRLNMAITAFLLASAVFLPLSGWVGDRFGAKRVYLASMVLFAVSSAGCGLSQNLEQLVVGRMIQGASAAMMAPVARLVLLRSTPKSELVSALSIYTMPAVFAPLAGPALGGFIVTYFDWRWIFFINLPLAAISILLAMAYVPDIPKEKHVPKIDWTGLALTGVALASLVFALENVGRAFLPGWQVAALFALGVVCSLLYWRHARGNPNAAVDISLFKIPTYAAATLGGAFQRLLISATPFLLAILLQIGFGMTAFAAGLMVVASGSASLFMKFLAPPLIERFGFRNLMIFNGVAFGLSFMMYALFRPGMAIWLMVVILAVGGLFRSLQFTALSGLGFADVSSAQMSRASTLTSMTVQLVQTIGVTFATILLHANARLRGEAALTWQAVSPVFVVMGLMTMLSLIWYVRMPKDAGASLSGRATP